MSKEETFFDRLSRGEKISCTAHDEILNGKNPCAIVKDLYKQLAELKAKDDNLYKCYQKTSRRDLKDKYDLAEENEQLKAENERLAKENQMADSLIKLHEKSLKNYLQQLKEKDEEIAEMKELDKATCESLYASRELFEKEKVKRWKLEKQLKFNTKQVCEKIKEKFSDGRSHNWGIEQVDLYDFLDQIEKGE